MTIRFTCDTCGSVLKIKDELAGTDGKCPKCKTRFVVPPPSPEAPVSSSAAVAAEPTETNVVPSPLLPPAVLAAVVVTTPESAPSAKAPGKVPDKSPAKPAAKTPDKSTPKAAAKPAEDEEFDPVSFLMEGPKKKPVFEADMDTTPSPKSAGRPDRNGGGGGGFSLDDDGGDAAQDFDAPPPTRKWGAKKEVTAAAAADRSMGGSTIAARDLLARSMEESRVRASEMPEEKPRFNFDFAGFIREIGIKGGGTILGIVVAVYGTYWLMNNMMGGKQKLPPLGYVSGTLTIGGKPAVGVKVYLTPLDHKIEGANERKEKARESGGVTDAEGRFTMWYLPDIEGAKVGPCRLWMESYDPSVVIPPSYGLATDHKVDVKAGNNEPLKIEL